MRSLSSSPINSIRAYGDTLSQFFLTAFPSPPLNDNAPPPEPEPYGGVLPVPANDNRGASSSERPVFKWAAILGAGTILMAGSLGYLPRPQKPLLPNPACSKSSGQHTKAQTENQKVFPRTSLSSLSAIQREQLIDAMQRQEGWRPGTTSFRGNNPGNLNDSRWTRAHGSIGANHGIAKFPDYETGRAAMKALIFGVYGDRTIDGMLAGDPTRGVKGYAPAVRDQFGHMGDPGLYADHVATWMNEMTAQASGDLRPTCAAASPRAGVRHVSSRKNDTPRKAEGESD